MPADNTWIAFYFCTVDMFEMRVMQSFTFFLDRSSSDNLWAKRIQKCKICLPHIHYLGVHYKSKHHC